MTLFKLLHNYAGLIVLCAIAATAAAIGVLKLLEVAKTHGDTRAHQVLVTTAQSILLGQAILIPMVFVSGFVVSGDRWSPLTLLTVVLVGIGDGVLLYALSEQLARRGMTWGISWIASRAAVRKAQRSKE